MSSKLWLRLAGIARFPWALFIERGGEGGGGGAGAGGAGGGAGGGGGTPGGPGTGGGTPPGGTEAGGTPSTASPAAAAAPRSEAAAASLSTQDLPSSLTDDTGRPVRELGESAESFQARYREYKTKTAATAEAETPEQKAAKEKAALAAAETPEQKAAREAAAAETPEQKAAREKAAREAAETPEQKATREEAERKAQAAQLLGGEDYDLAPLPTERLADAIKKAPEKAKAFFEAAGIHEDDLYATARLADRAAQYVAAGLPTVEAAKHAVVRARAFHTLEDKFTGLQPGDVQGTMKFLNDVLLPMSYLRDGETGQVLMDDKTKLPMTDGTVFHFMDNLYDTKLDFQAKQILNHGNQKVLGSFYGAGKMVDILNATIEAAKKIGGEAGDSIMAAAITLKELGKAGGSSGSREGLSPEALEALEENDRLKAEKVTQEKERRAADARAYTEKETAFTKEVLTASSAEIDKLVGEFLQRTTLGEDKFLRATVAQKIRAALYDNMSSDGIYLSQRDQITLHGLTEKTKKSWIALNIGESKARLRTVAEPILTEASARYLTRAEERELKIKSQQRGSQMEAPGGTSTSLPRPGGALLTDKELVAKARQNLNAANEDVNTESLMAEFRKLRAAQASAA